ncbi:MAG TPA: ABC transporter permease [Candidatus Saccharimonadales bacterium]|nr:ABC transporter permease [Candidatus Saccharimonadales bacterium]
MSTTVQGLTSAPIAGGSAPAVPRFRALRLPHSPKVIAGLVILLLFALLAVIGPVIAPYSPTHTDLRWVQIVPAHGLFGSPQILPLSPSRGHLLGTTIYANDVLSQLLVSARATMLVGFLAGAAATLLSIVVGVTAGYIGGFTDDGLSLASNVFLAIPGLPLLIVLASYVPGADSSPVLIALIVAVTGWAYGARTLRAQTLSLRNREFVEAARVSGESSFRIIVYEVLPNLVPIAASSFLFTTLYALGAYVALAYLGLAGSNIWNWGLMLMQAQAESAPASGWWWWWAPPGFCIALLGCGLALLNFGMDEFINPRLRDAGLSRKDARRAGIRRRPKLGFTPVIRKPAP